MISKKKIKKKQGRKALNMNRRMLNEFNDIDYKNAIDEIKDALQKLKVRPSHHGSKPRLLTKRIAYWTP